MKNNECPTLFSNGKGATDTTSCSRQIARKSSATGDGSTGSDVGLVRWRKGRLDYRSKVASMLSRDQPEVP